MYKFYVYGFKKKLSILKFRMGLNKYLIWAPGQAFPYNLFTIFVKKKIIGTSILHTFSL